MSTEFLAQGPILSLLMVLVVLLILSAFFSGSETSMMAVNPYKLRHLAKTSKSAKRVLSLFKQRERLLSVILIGNNFVNIAASSIATIIGLQLLGDTGVYAATILLTIVLLIFGEITPKTMASLKPDKYAGLCSWPLIILMKLFYPLAVLTNFLSMLILKLFGFNRAQSSTEGLTEEELLTVVKTSKDLLSSQHHLMMSSILNLRNITVDDLMVHKNDVLGIDLDKSEAVINSMLYNPKHTFLPVYDKDINNLKGILHNKDIPSMIANGTTDKESIKKYLKPAYFTPEATSLHNQLLQFKVNKARLGFVVDEYGDIQGIITIDDIIREIIGDVPNQVQKEEPLIIARSDGSYIVDGNINLRKLNRKQKWTLPLDGAKTLNGLILEYLDGIPTPATCIDIDGHRMEVLQVQDNVIKKIKFYPLFIDSE